MDVSAEALARAIGVRVKHERTLRGWTLDQLAEYAGVSRRMVINVEQGSVNPSVGTLLRLSDALGVGLPALVETRAGKASKVTRNGEGAVLWTGVRGGHGVLVAGTEPPDILELWDWTLMPGERHDSEAHAERTRELLHVLDGAVTIVVGEQVHELGTGDAVTFFSDIAHSYANPHDAPARFSLSVYEPGVGTARATAVGDG